MSEIKWLVKWWKLLETDFKHQKNLKVGQKCPAFILHYMYYDIIKDVKRNEEVKSFDE